MNVDFKIKVLPCTLQHNVESYFSSSIGIVLHVCGHGNGEYLYLGVIGFE